MFILSDYVTGVLQDLTVTAVVAVISAIFVKNYAKAILLSNKMKKLGFDSVSLKGQTDKEKRDIFTHASVIKIMNVSGYHYLNENEKYIKSALERGIKIKFMCAYPFSTFLNSIERLEMVQGLRSEGDLITKEIFDLLNKYAGTGLEIRFYNTEYRLPMIIADYGDKTKAWLTVTLPPYKSTNSFIMRGTSSEDADFIDMMTTHFDTVWNHTAVTFEDFSNKIISVQQKEMEEKLKAAKAMMQKAKENGRSILIEVAAQHPLLNGRYPGQEFKGRLDRALEVARQYDTEQVCFYVPGNLHKHDGVEDEISLSQSGAQYLMEHGVAADKIYGLAANDKYCGERGVYNSTDECYVAGCLFKDMNFAKLICVCSPAQMMRKMFSYISYGYYPEIQTYCCDEMYHDYIEEFFRAIPIVVNDKGILQGKSLEAERLKEERVVNR